MSDNEADEERDGLGSLLTLPKQPTTNRRKSNIVTSSIVQQQLGKKKGTQVLELFLNAIREVSSKTDPQDVADTIITQACKLVNCDRSTIFYVDDETDELVLMVAKGVRNIRLPIGSGIAGSCAQNGRTENIENAYADSRFSDRHDKQTGYKTNAVVATPVVDHEGSIVAVLQCINKKDTGGGNKGRFTPEDVCLMENFASHIGIVLRNAHLHEIQEKAKHKMEGLVEIVQTLHSGASNTHSLIFTLTHRCSSLVEADRTTLYLVDKHRKQLVVMQGDVDIRVPLEKGLAGWVATHGKALNIPDAYEDDRFSQAVDKSSGYRTKSVLCMPIFGRRDRGDEDSSSSPGIISKSQTGSKSARPVVGVLQVINKTSAPTFSHVDEDILITLLNIAGPMLEQSNFFAQPAPKSVSPENEFHPSKGKRDSIAGFGLRGGTGRGGLLGGPQKSKPKYKPRKMSLIGENVVKYASLKDQASGMAAMEEEEEEEI